MIRNLSTTDFINLNSDEADVEGLKKFILNNTFSLRCYKIIGRDIRRDVLLDKGFVTSFSNKYILCLKQKINKIKIRRGVYSTILEGKEIPESIVCMSKFFNDVQKEDVAKYLSGHLDKFYVYSRKLLIQLIIDWTSNNVVLNNVVEKNYRILSNNQIHTISSKTKLSNKAQEYLLRMPEYALNLFSKEDLADPDKRSRYIKLIAEKDAFYNASKFRMTITKEDLEKLPAVTRFKFMKKIYEPLLVAFANACSKCQVEAETDLEVYVKPDSMTMDDISELLFPVSIEKNIEVKRWMKKVEQVVGYKNKLRKLIYDLDQWI